MKEAREGIKMNITSTTVELIRQLNSKLRGWVHYYKYEIMKYLPIVRHVKVKMDATIYDPAYKKYFEKRERLKRNSSHVHWVHNKTLHLVGEGDTPPNSWV